MNKKTYISSCLLVICLIFFASCQQHRVQRTVHLALKNIETKNYKAMKSLIGTNAIQDTFMFGIVSKMVEASYFLDKYHSGTIKDLKPIYTDSIDDFGRHIIIIPLYNKYDSSTGLYNANIILSVGPFNLFPPNKLTGFEVETAVDEKRRKYLFNNKIPTYNFDSAAYKEYGKIK